MAVVSQTDRLRFGRFYPLHPSDCNRQSGPAKTYPYGFKLARVTSSSLQVSVKKSLFTDWQMRPVDCYSRGASRMYGDITSM